jgi:hypothetical protein
MSTRSRVYTVEGAQRALRKLPKELQTEMRKASQEIAQDIATRAASAARQQGGVARHVAPSIKAKRDRYPVVVLGGTQRLGGPALGAEFGGGARPRTRQFQPHRGTRGYFMFPTVRDRSDEALKSWLDALQKSLDAI